MTNELSRPMPPAYRNRVGRPASVVRHILPAALGLLALVGIGSPMAQSPAGEVRRPGLFYSLQHPTWPPFPANPFPDLPVYWIEADRFVFDDGAVDYDQLAAKADALATERALLMAVAAAEERLIGGQPIICSSGYPEELYIEKQAEDWVSLSGDLEPNRGYLLLSKMDLWEPSWSAEEGFIAPWSGTTFQATAPMKYFQLVKEPTDTLVFIEKIQDAIEPVSGVPGSGRNGKFQIWRERAHGVYDSSLTVHFTIGGTAVNGSDYATLMGPATIQAGYLAVEIEVVPYADASEFDEDVTLTLQPVQPPTYFIKRAGASATVTIYDPQPTFTVAVERPGGPIGIDYHPVEDALLISDYWWGLGIPRNFTRIKKVGGTVECTPWSSVTNLWDEIKLTTVKSSAANFVLGDMFFGYKPESGNTRIGRVYRSASPPNEVIAVMDWAILQNETSPVHGGLYVDQTGVFNRDLIVVTGGEAMEGGRIWRITSNADQTSNTKTVFAEIPNTHLEGVVSLPNDQQKYGPWAGKIVTGAERRDPPLIYTIDPNGNVAEFAEEIAPEDFDIIPAGQALYCNDGIAGNIYKVPAAYFTEYVGDLLITQAGEVQDFPAVLLIFHWDGSRFVKKSVFPPEGALFEHVTFAPVDL